ncbi:hypothetical protein BSK59_13385 [Paenibacillus odorifer]|uniref:helix-turn-helix transcriptional regulator n=1 Tax=Paenibacillus odorifer TaxID=189426 RepID=UPI00096EDB8E|nr:helix-turn-helix transcriptional regulator [Paenibacillus odorifer]OME55465.1 hypothetical protein BSK59_13385 [Paenibacillus odorifer]
MISYAPFLEFLERNDCPRTFLVQKGIMSTRTLAKLDKNEPISLEIIEKISKEFKLPISSIVVLLDDDGNPFTGESMPDHFIKEFENSFFTKKRKCRIREFKSKRMLCGYTQKEIANLIGVSPALITVWEKNEDCLVTEEQAAKIMEIFGLTEDDIIKEL